MLQVNAAGLTVTDQDGVSQTVTSDGECQFSADESDAINKVMVSSGGILVVHSQSKTVATDRSFTIGLPEQTLPVAGVRRHLECRRLGSAQRECDAGLRGPEPGSHFRCDRTDDCHFGVPGSCRLLGWARARFPGSLPMPPPAAST